MDARPEETELRSVRVVLLASPWGILGFGFLRLLTDPLRADYFPQQKQRQSWGAELAFIAQSLWKRWFEHLRWVFTPAEKMGVLIKSEEALCLAPINHLLPQERWQKESPLSLSLIIHLTNSFTDVDYSKGTRRKNIRKAKRFLNMFFIWIVGLVFF